MAVTRLLPPCVARAATPRTPAYPACSPMQQSPPLSPSTGGRAVWRGGHGRRHGRWTGARAKVHARSGGLGVGALPLQRLHQLHVPQHREPLPVPHHRHRACLRRLLPRQTRVAHGAPTQRRHCPSHRCAVRNMPACPHAHHAHARACTCTHGLGACRSTSSTSRTTQSSSARSRCPTGTCSTRGTRSPRCTPPHAR